MGFNSGLKGLTLLFMACDLEGWKGLLTFMSTVFRIPETEQFMSTVFRIPETEQFVYTFWKTQFKVISFFTFANFIFDLSFKL